MTDEAFTAIGWIVIAVLAVLVAVLLIQLIRRSREIEKLQRQKDNLDALFRSVPVAAGLIDLDGTVLLSNEDAGRQFNMVSAEIIGSHFSESLPEEAVRNIEELLARVRETRKICSREDYFGDRYFSAHVCPVFNAGGEIIRFGIFSRDITEPRRDFENLQESEAKLRVLLEESPNIIVTTDGEGRVTYLNYEMPDFKREEMIGQLFTKRLQPEHRQMVLSEIATVARENRSITREVLSILDRFYRIQFFPLEDQPDGARVMMIGTDITEIKRAEQELRELNERLSRTNTDLSDSNNRLMDSNVQLIQSQQALRDSEQQLRRIVENIAEVIFTVNPEGFFTYVSPGWTILLGHPLEEVQGRHFLAFVADENREMLEQDFERVLNSEEKLTIQEHRIRHRDGSWREFRSSLTPVRAVDGSVQFFVGISEDITEQLLVEQRLRQIQKMEALGTLAGGIAHDFNNILYALIGYNKMALEDTEDGSDLHAIQQEIMTGLKRAADLVKQILAFSRQSKTERSEQDLGLIARETIGLIKATVPPNVTLRTDLQAANPIWANPTEIHQVLMNLITNALRAMPEGGTLGISLDMVEVSPQEVSLYGLETGIYSRLTISDTGIGMTEEVRERIFDPFFTTREVGQGTGMGLSVSHGIISDLGGRILVDSQPGEGTVFTVMVPGVRHSQGATYDPADHHTYRVMILIKGATEQEMYGRMFKRHGFSSFGFSSPVAALTDLAAAPEAYDLVLTDEALINQHPGLLKELRSIKSGLPVILCSGADHGTGSNSEGDPAMTLLTKPVGHRRLIAETRRLLGLSQ